MNHPSEQSTAWRPIQLAWDGSNAVIKPDDLGRFVSETQRAVVTNQSGLAAERFWQQFADEFLPAVHQWCQEHQDRVAACYIPPPKDHLRVFVVTRSESYDFTLSHDLSDLEMDLFEKQWLVDINQIPNGPPSVLEAFFEPVAAIQIYANSG